MTCTQKASKGLSNNILKTECVDISDNKQKISQVAEFIFRIIQALTSTQKAPHGGLQPEILEAEYMKTQVVAHHEVF